MHTASPVAPGLLKRRLTGFLSRCLLLTLIDSDNRGRRVKQAARDALPLCRLAPRPGGTQLGLSQAVDHVKVALPFGKGV